MAALRILVVGHVTHDRFGEGMRSRIVAGGSAYYGSRAHRSLGAEVRLLTAVGGDFTCEDDLEGLEVVTQRSGRTTEFQNLYTKDGGRLQIVGGQADPLRPAEAGRECCWDLVHLAPVLGEVDLVAWRRAVRARIWGIGVQGWIKIAGPADADGRRRVVPRRWTIEPGTLEGVDVACLSDDDLADQGDLLDRLRAAVPMVALTHGARGAELFESGRVTQVGIHPSTEVDPTGAGDAFAAVFMHEVARGSDPVAAARLAAAAGSIVVEAEGGRSLERLGEAALRAPAIPTCTR
jgi:sugar/nucleoside kinase (ribokinase family)